MGFILKGMKLDPEEQKRGTLWFMISAPVAIGLTIALYFVNEGLTNSTSEADIGKTLRELRTAQTTLHGAAIDPRQNDGSELVAVKNSAAE